MIIIVTGAAGYVGSALTNLLLSRGHRVVAIDNDPHRMRQLSMQLRGSSAEFRRTSLDELSENVALLASADALVHLAGISSDAAAERDADLTWRVNVNSAVALARAAKAAGVPRFLLASTLAISQVPVGSHLESALLDGDKPSGVTRPIGIYAQSKLAAEQAIKRLSDRTFEVTVLRKGSLYGCSLVMRWDLVINKIALAAWSGHPFLLHDRGAVWRPIAHVHDAARAYLHLLRLPRGVGSQTVFDLVERNVLLSDVCLEIDAVARLELGRGIIFHHGTSPHPQRTGRVSGDSLVQIGWSPRRSLRDGIQELLRRLAGWQTRRPDETAHEGQIMVRTESVT